MKRYASLASLLTIVVCLLSSCGFEMEKVDEVSVYEMQTFEDVKDIPVRTFTKRNEILVFEKAIQRAKKQRGIVDMADPQYKVALGGKSFFLWVSPKHATIMDVENTHTIYSVSSRSSKNLNELLN